MRLNYDVCLLGDKVVLVPYRKKYVPRYHAWMSDPILQEQTASEPLSLEEEYAMQRSWRDDADKLTFIVLDRSLPGAAEFHTSAMVGDVNLFLNDPDSRAVAETEVMIAESGARRRGLAAEAVVLLLRYAHQQLGIMRFYAKIGAANTASLRLFRAKLGFVDCNFVPAFQEHELELLLVPASHATLLDADEAAFAAGPRLPEEVVHDPARAERAPVPDGSGAECRRQPEKSLWSARVVEAPYELEEGEAAETEEAPNATVRPPATDAQRPPGTKP